MAKLKSCAEIYFEIADWWKSLDEAERELYLTESFPPLFSYHSGKIENSEITYHDTRQIFDNGRIVGYTGDVRTVYEINNLKASWETALSLIADRRAVDTDTLLRLHETLTFGTYDEDRWAGGERPGTFKKGDYGVADDVGYSPAESPTAVTELLDELQPVFAGAYSPSPHNALVSSCYAHAKLVEIHPFSDGNGRTARLLQNICLIASDLPPVVFREPNRLAYFGALDQFHEDADLNGLLDLTQAESIHVWQRHACVPLHAETDGPSVREL